MQDTVGVNSGFSQRFVDKAREAATVDGGLELSSAMRAKDGESVRQKYRRIIACNYLS